MGRSYGTQLHKLIWVSLEAKVVGNFSLSGSYSLVSCPVSLLCSVSSCRPAFSDGLLLCAWANVAASTSLNAPTTPMPIAVWPHSVGISSSAKIWKNNQDYNQASHWLSASCFVFGFSLRGSKLEQIPREEGMGRSGRWADGPTGLSFESGRFSVILEPLSFSVTC